MRTDILNHLQKLIYERCQKPENHFGAGCYYHIEAVVKNAALLADSYGADKEVVMIAAWLHDIASVTDYALYPLHHIHGAEMASEILRSFDYPADKIHLVQACIRSHRGSYPLEKYTPEELCVADADAISHFDNVCSLLHLAYHTKGMEISEGKAYVRGKLERSYQKLSDNGRAYYHEKCEKILNSGIV